MKFEDKPVVIKRSHILMIFLMVFNFYELGIPGWLAILPGIMMYIDMCKDFPTPSQP